MAAKLTASRNDDDAISGAWPQGVTIFLRGRDCHRAPLLAPCHGGVPRSGVRTMRGVVFINNQPASARHHAKDERHVPTPAQCEASSSSIANRCPREHRHARRSVVGWSLYIVPNLGGALPSSSTTQARIPPPPVARLWATSTSYRLSVPAGGARQFPGPRLVASFDVVSAEIPPHRAPVLAHPSPTRRRDATAHVLRRGVR